MGYVIRRRLGSGRVRYTAVYGDIRGRRRSAGTFATAKLAAKAWQKAEADLASGRIGDPRRGQQTLRRYVEQEWFPNHLIEATTREGYTYLLNRYILPELGEIRMVEILPGQVREWITRLQDVYGARPPTIRKCKVVLDAILTTALNDQITVLHAGRGVKTPPVATRPRRIITVEQFDRILAALDDDTMRLLVETDIESGLRWGELTELRVRDIDFETGTLTVSRVVVHLRAKSLGGGPRFVVKDYPKDKEWRQLRLAPHILAQLTAHVANRGLGRDDLLFAMPKSLVARRRTVPDRLPDPNTLGLTEPNAVGRRYRHGTTTAYTNGRCRCQHCRDAISAYRAARRAAGRDQPRAARIVETDGHIGNDWFRANVWRKAMDAADLGFRVTPHSLRHAHASWLLAGGADIQVVKERLGHGSIVTTERYLRALPTARDAGLAALDSVRRSGSATTSVASTDASARDAELSELAELVIKLQSLQRSLASRSS